MRWIILYGHIGFVRCWKKQWCQWRYEWFVEKRNLISDKGRYLHSPKKIFMIDNEMNFNMKEGARQWCHNEEPEIFYNCFTINSKAIHKWFNADSQKNSAINGKKVNGFLNKLFLFLLFFYLRFIFEKISMIFKEIHIFDLIIFIIYDIHFDYKYTEKKFNNKVIIHEKFESFWFMIHKSFQTY